MIKSESGAVEIKADDPIELVADLYLAMASIHAESIKRGNDREEIANDLFCMLLSDETPRCDFEEDGFHGDMRNALARALERIYAFSEGGTDRDCEERRILS